MAATALSILIPLFNEREYIGEILERVAAAPLPENLAREIVVVDDGSEDGSAEAVRTFIAAHPEIPLRLFRHERNRGKGAAVRTAIAEAKGEFSLIQDADLEYDPSEYPRLLAPLLSGRADVVFGSRFLVSGERRVLYYWHSLANKLLTTLCNIAADVNLTDMETCYKAFRTDLAQSIPLTSERFGIEPELTIKFARRRARIYETPISYYGRTYEEGKKIGLKDAFEAVWVIFRSRLSRRLYVDGGPAALDALSAATRFNRWMAEVISPWVGDRVLEIGAGIGNLTRHLCARRSLYAATDYEPAHVEQLRRGFARRPNVQVGRLDAERPKDYEPWRGLVDTIVCLNVLEHIRDDGGTVERMFRTVSPGGRVILLVPNDPRAYGTLDRAVGHYRRYTPETLRSVIEGAGLRVDRVLHFNRISTPGWHFTGKVLKAGTLSPAGLRIFDKFVWFWRRIDGILPWPATSLIAIATKPDAT